MNVYGLTGYPLTHSFSKTFFTEKFEKENLQNCRFDLFPLKNIEDFPGIFRIQQNIRGLAVTIPHKQAIIAYLDNLEPIAKKCGAVNCIKISFDNILTGYNTDITGFEKTLIPLLHSHHSQALILGAGGASKAVQFVLSKLGIRFLIVTRKKNDENSNITYAELNRNIIGEYPVIINCTPVGMSPETAIYPEIPYDFLTGKHLLYDLVYTPAFTAFLKKGAAKGAMVKNGYDMLISQADENWRIWNEL